METLLFVWAVSLFILLAMASIKFWQVRGGKAGASEHLHLVGPVVKATHDYAVGVYRRLHVSLQPTITKLYADVLHLAYTACAGMAKRFAKIANEIKGKGELPVNASGASLILAYARRDTGSEE